MQTKKHRCSTALNAYIISVACLAVLLTSTMTP